MRCENPNLYSKLNWEGNKTFIQIDLNPVKPNKIEATWRSLFLKSQWPSAMISADIQSLSMKTAEEAAELDELDDHQQPHKSEGIRVRKGGGAEVSVLQCRFLRTVHFRYFEFRGASRKKTSVSRRVRRKVMKATPEWEQSEARQCKWGVGCEFPQD